MRVDIQWPTYLLLASVETAGIGLAKDLFFSGIDYAGGYIDGSQFGTQVGKAILGAGVNVGVGALFNGVGNFKEVTTIAGDGLETVTKVAELGGLKAVVGNDLMQNTLVKAGMSALQTYTSGVASGMVGAIGLLEMRLGGKDGFSMGIGSGGTDVSFGTVAAAMAGLKDAGKVIGAKLSGNIESISTLNAVNMLGWTGNDLNQKTAKDIWDGDLKVTYGDIGDEYGEYKIGSDGVTISKAMLGGGKEGSAKLATVMAHEGTHVAGNRIEAIAHLQGSGTYQTITAMFGLQGDDAFRGEMIGAILNPESWKENTGDTDFWKLKFYEGGMVELIDDKRSSLYIDTAYGEEFNLWNMDDLSIEEAKERITGSGLQPEGGLSLSGETMKRLGMFAILNANSNNLSEEQFGNIAAKSYLDSSGLGYYIDFSSVLNYINQNFSGRYFTDGKKSMFQQPDYDYSFNPATLANIFVYGTMGTLGYTATVDGNPYFANQNNPNPRQEYHVETEDGNLSFGWEQIREEYNNQKVRLTNTQPPQKLLVRLPNIIPNPPDKVAVGGSGVISAMQFADGAVKARNINSIHVNTWNVFGQSFFTLQTTAFSSMQSTNAKFIYKFVTAEESRLKKFSKAIETAAKGILIK